MTTYTQKALKRLKNDCTLVNCADYPEGLVTVGADFWDNLKKELEGAYNRGWAESLVDDFKTRKAFLKEPYTKTKQRTKENHQKIKKLRAEGYSIRQIMRVLGWKSPASVHAVLKGDSQK